MQRGPLKVLRSTQYSAPYLNRPRLISKLKDLELNVMSFLDRSVYRAWNVIIASYILFDLTTVIHLSILKHKLILISKNHWLYHTPMLTMVFWTHWAVSLYLVDLQILIWSKLIIWSWIFSSHNISIILITMCLAWTHDLLS
jgi:hypothetical protein